MNLGAQASAFINQQANGLDVYGDPAGWVPVLSIGTIRKFVDDTLLPTVLSLEGALSVLESRT